jgi:hypothetical protein
MNDDSNAAARSERGERPGKPAARPSAGRRKAAPPEDPVQRAIGEQLREVFDEVVRQPVPERFAQLLRKLAEQEQKKK